MRTWGYIKNTALVKLDFPIDHNDSDNQISDFEARFPYYANEAMTQICSTVLPKYSYYTVGVYKDDNVRWKYCVDRYSILGYDKDTIIKQPELTLEQAADTAYVEAYNRFWYEYENCKPGWEIEFPADFVSFGSDINTREFTNCYNEVETEQLADWDFRYYGYKSFVPYKEGIYHMSYNARWYDFNEVMYSGDIITAPDDVLDCIPSYIVSQCYKVDDEVKAQIYRNEFEMFLARINNSHHYDLREMRIKDNW